MVHQQNGRAVAAAPPAQQNAAVDLFKIAAGKKGRKHLTQQVVKGVKLFCFFFAAVGDRFGTDELRKALGVALGAKIGHNMSFLSVV